jgi:hypothetical protein
MSERVTRVREELEQRADAGATLLELETVLDGHKNNPRLSADEYDELWLYAWALLHRPRRAGKDNVGYGIVQPG